jgi:DNA ligase-1
MQKLEKLYKIDSLGKLREWTMVIDGDSFHAEKGLVGGKIVCDKPTTAIGKNEGKVNETTNEEQALLEAQARWDKKLKEGYALTPKEAETMSYYEPMLAQKFEDREKEIQAIFDDELRVLSQPKLDGIRCVIRVEDGEIVARTRKGRTIDTIPHVIEELSVFFDCNKDAILDGELYNHDLKHDFNKIVSLVRKKTPEMTKGDSEKSFARKQVKYEQALIESEKLIQYWVYDCPKLSDDYDESILFSARNFMLQGEFADVVDGNSVKLVETNECYSFLSLDQAYSSFMENGYEGQMVRIDGAYESKRSKSLLKRKEFQDAEYKVTDIDEGNGNRSGTAKHLVCYCDKTKQTFNANIKGNFDYLAEILENREYYIGKLATIKFFELTPDGVPRFPYAIAFRDYE